MTKKSPPRPAPHPAAAPAKAAKVPMTGIPIVGIGASAGGLEALEEFLSGVTADCGLAFVVVQHLDPTREGMLAELLQHATAMPVRQAEDHMEVEANHVYVIPPNRDLSVLHGVLHLFEPGAPRGLRLPIDFFLRSLAADMGELSMGVILSGMGADGSEGLTAIKEKGGRTFVQAPASAKYDSMPRSAIAAGVADVVAPVEQLAGEIARHVRKLPRPLVPSAVVRHEGSDIEKLIIVLREQTGQDFSGYKESTIARRIDRRMAMHRLSTTADYLAYLRDNPQEAMLLFKELLIGVTSFFRDPAVWNHLQTEAIPALLASHPEGARLRAWVPGCSTGEEAYSLAIVFREALELQENPTRYSLQIFATDLDQDAIDKARAASYPSAIEANVSAERIDKYFDRHELGYCVRKEIRGMVIFAPQNLIMDPPFTRLDIVSCRNLFIYLEPDAQKRLLPLFHYSLNDNGILILGSSETVGHSRELFTPLPGTTRIYRRRNRTGPIETTIFPTAIGSARADMARAYPATPAQSAVGGVQALTDALLLKDYAPAAVLTTESGDIVYFSGKTGKYLEPAAGKANLNVFAMARPGLAGAMNVSFGSALRQHEVVKFKAVIAEADEAPYAVKVTIHQLTEESGLQGMVLLVFANGTDAVPKVHDKAKGKAAVGSALALVSQELDQARNELRRTREEMQVSQEELKSANEELQSTNEELQSINEELTTSREEMQSMNEELQTVNNELQAKLNELLRASDDMANLLNSTDIATLFLDDELRVRRFTTQMTGIVKLIPADAGRPITDLVTVLDYPELAEDARQVLKTLIFRECQVSASDGRFFAVRIMPYRTQDKRIDGVVITFTDVTAPRNLESTMREALEVLQGRVKRQSGELDKARALESVLQSAQTVLEQRLADQKSELRAARENRRGSAKPDV